MTHGWRTRKPHNAATRQRIREYNSTEYKRARQAAKQQVAAGQAHCWRCGQPIPPGSNWHLGHDDHNRAILHGPEHARCNLHAAAIKGNRISNRHRHRIAAAARRWAL